jgi:hypothetical protein
MIVVGNAIEKDSSLIKEMSDAIHSARVASPSAGVPWTKEER